MLNVTHVLDHIGIDQRSCVRAVQDASSIVRDASDPLRAARKMFQDVLSLDVRFDDEVYARVCCAKMIEQVVKTRGIVDNEQVVLDAAHSYAQQFCHNPANAFLYAKPENPTVVSTSVQVVKDIDVKVAVKADGKIKKGGKQVLAMELYKKHVIEATTPMTNQQFIALLMKELNMTKAGATTYNYNCKKAQ